MSTCLSCGQKTLQIGMCPIDTPDNIGRQGTHPGRCWDGRFPPARNEAPLPLNTEQATSRGRSRHKEAKQKEHRQLVSDNGFCSRHKSHFCPCATPWMYTGKPEKAAKWDE